MDKKCMVSLEKAINDGFWIIKMNYECTYLHNFLVELQTGTYRDPNNYACKFKPPK